MNTFSKSKGSDTTQRGFTLLELAAVMAVLVLVAMTLLPAHAGSKTKSQSLRCLDNQRQVINAVESFSHDHQDLLPPNPDDGTTLSGYTWCVGGAGIGQSDEFDPDILKDPVRCLLAPYTGTNVSVYHCTADARTGLYDGAALYPSSPLKGTRVPAARTISMSQAVGTIDPGFASGSGHSGVPNLPVNGPWLTGTHGANSAQNGPYRTYGKISQMVLPAPAQLIVMTEEAPYSINDQGLAASANLASPKWIDFPSSLHNNAGVVSFADGHVELHKWLGQSLNVSTITGSFLLPNDPDFLWVAQHISAHF